MKKLSILLVLSIFVLSGCHKSSLKQQLVEIDSVAENESNGKALTMLDKIEPSLIADEECLAYYWLLKMRTEIRLQRRISSATPLDISIEYYKKHDKLKLARAYCYKAFVLDNLGNIKEAVICLKEAEQLIKDVPAELKLSNLIYSILGRLNHKVNEWNYSLDYSQKALKSAYKLNDDYYIAYSLMNIYIDYHDMGNQDSAKYYLDKCIPLVDQLPENERYSFYANIGNAFFDSDIKQAEDYLRKSVDIKPNVFAYKGLARIYYKNGEREKALEMWHKALQTDNMYLKAEILQALYESQQDEGDYKSASETAMQIASLKDSITQKEKADNIRGLQEQFEIDRVQAVEEHRLYMIVLFVGMLLLLSMAAVTYLVYRNTKSREELHNTKLQLDRYRNELKVLEQEGKSDSREVERLTQKINELQVKQGTLLQNGRERYEEVMSGGTTIRWKRNDFADCIEYYRTIDAAFVTHMETSYRHLSSKYIFFALMQHLGKTDEELQHVMAIGQNTVRSIRSRINSTKIE